MAGRHPYHNLELSAFWDKAVSGINFLDTEHIWKGRDLIDKNLRTGTAGSCFAQHVTAGLKKRGFKFMDLELKPDFIEDDAEAKNFGYGIYSCRYGNIYSLPQLLQLLEEASGEFSNADPVWENDGRYYDSSRPAVMPGGVSSENLIRENRKIHLEKVRELFTNVELFVFTLGLTEVWRHSKSGMVFPTAPGVIAGDFDRDKYHFDNLSYEDNIQAFNTFHKKLSAVNPGVRIIITVSPVPFKATYSGDHVLVANTRSKSLLRTVADAVSNKYDNVHYFPSYELINAHPGRAMFYEPDMRRVNSHGVDFVMEHFFGNKDESGDDSGVLCDDEFLT